MKKPELPFSLDSIEPLIQKIGELTKIQRLLIFSGSLALVIALMVWALYIPKLNKISTLEKQIKKTREELVLSKKNARQYPLLKKKVKEAEIRFQKLTEALPNSREIPSLLTGISNAGKEAGLKFLLFVPQKEKIKEFYAEIPIKMELSGGYHDLGVFYDKLARELKRIVTVKDFSIVNSPTGSRALKITCTAETYRFLDPEEIKAYKEAQEKKKKKKKRGRKKKK